MVRVENFGIWIAKGAWRRFILIAGSSKEGTRTEENAGKMSSDLLVASRTVGMEIWNE